ncbi:MAG: hypothetical protein A3I66_06400 [Burkholderiales bacterium RIFCSPLOWO2_02_FULL_57_36]|nr:MAG: hypothetical protein A3I66_06400 [Burkholderiales bacterium RIFCSPLOWO2_02_FULL_57_36]
MFSFNFWIRVVLSCYLAEFSFPRSVSILRHAKVYCQSGTPTHIQTATKGLRMPVRVVNFRHASIDTNDRMSTGWSFRFINQGI